MEQYFQLVSAAWWLLVGLYSHAHTSGVGWLWAGSLSAALCVLRRLAGAKGYHVASADGGGRRAGHKHSSGPRVTHFLVTLWQQKRVRMTRFQSHVASVVETGRGEEVEPFWGNPTTPGSSDMCFSLLQETREYEVSI